ncbi:MAG TPA: CRTAC1 family protein, partial [Chthonomonadaceae bacterium]|nr:CRTAC1 family protein [Chthonomonadaceae bacterium]
FIDYDGDGYLDILLLNGAPLPGGHVTGRPTLKLYHNNHNGTFTDVTHQAGLDKSVMYAMGVAVGDYDNDGHEDFYVSCVLGPGHLFHNEGNGTFTDMTQQAGVANAGNWGSSCAWVDYDRDGRLDLLVCNYVRYGSLADERPCYAGVEHKRVYCLPLHYPPSHCVLYHNEGNGHFRDVSAESGIAAAAGKSLGVTVWDYDGDGWPDLFIANDTEPCFLFHNNGNGTFKEVGLESSIAYEPEGGVHAGMGIDADDADNDGKTCLVFTNFFGQQTSFYRQVVPGIFRDERQEARIGPQTASVLGFGAFFFDYDNDGWKDILQVNGHVQDDIREREPQASYAEPTLLFRNQGNGTYQEVGLKSGKPFSQPLVGRGCAWGDIDNDGRLDLLLTSNTGPAYLWHNETPTPYHWLTLKPVGTKSNRDGIGAMVLVNAGALRQRTMVRSGSSYLSASDLRPHFGLGTATTADVEIHWPSGTVDRMARVPADHIWTVREGEGTVR